MSWSRKWSGKWLCLAILAVPAGVWADYPVKTDALELHFSEFGALTSAVACYPKCAPGSDAKDPIKRAHFGGPANQVINHGLPPTAWTLTPTLKDGVQILRFENTQGDSLTWRIPRQGYQLQLEVAGSSSLNHLAIHSGAEFRPPPSAGFGPWLEQVRYIALPGRESDFDGARSALDEDESGAWLTDNWAGFRKRYWAFMLKPQASPVRIEATVGEAKLDASLRLNLDDKPNQFDIYIGPIEKNALTTADPALKDLSYGALWFWLRWICFALLWLLTGIHSVVNSILPASVSWGLSIMFLSVTVHILMRPLSRIADRFQDDVQATESRLAPELSRIRAAHKGEEQAQAVMALYKREGVHPLYSLKSLMGVAVVIPVFIGAFDMLAENIHLAGTGFLWIQDLARPDAIASLPFTLPFFGSDLNLLPFLMTALSVLASWLHQPPALHPSLRHKQVRNMLLLAGVFFVLFYTFPAGMVLYWTTNNLISAVKGAWQNRRRQPTH